MKRNILRRPREVSPRRKTIPNELLSIVPSRDTTYIVTSAIKLKDHETNEGLQRNRTSNHSALYVQ
jgi:hypothetical protein